jgi:hypothetical protein
MVQAIKGRIQDDPSIPIRRAYDVEFLALPANQRLEAPTFEEVRSALQRHRMTFIPMLPPDIYGVDIQGPWAQTWDGDRKLLAIDNIVGCCVFASDEELRILAQCDEIYIDGTFKTAPPPYSQIISIHGKFHGWRMPFAMAFSTGKRENQYRYIVREIKEAILRLTHNNFQPTVVITDFEVALINAIRNEIQAPNMNMYGCYFHFCQSLMRKAAELGLKVPYEQDPDVQRVIRRMLALGYIPTAHVRLMFV